MKKRYILVLLVPVIVLAFYLLRGVYNDRARSEMLPAKTEATLSDKVSSPLIPVEVSRQYFTQKASVPEQRTTRSDTNPHIPNHLTSLFAVSNGLPEKLMALDTLGNKLSTDEIRSLIVYLKQNDADHMTATQKNFLTHVVMERLLHCSGRSRLALNGLVEIALNETMDFVTRDYAIQHLGTWGEQGNDTQVIIDILWPLLQEKQSTITGTTLLSLNRILFDSDDTEQTKKLRIAALDIVTNGYYSAASRTTAIQLCREMNLPQSVPALRVIIEQRNHVPLTMSAIAALGVLGTENDAEFLHSLGRKTNSVYTTTIEAARQAINSKHRLQFKNTDRKDS